MSLNLKNDIIFKEFFSRKGNEAYLKEFLSELLEINITNINIMRDVSLERLSTEDKLGVLDIQAIIDDKTIVSVEMQMQYCKDMPKRDGFYSARELASFVVKKQKYSSIKPVIMINLLNYRMPEFRQYKDFINQIITVSKKHRECEIDTGIQYYFIELPKFRKSNPDMNNKLNQWIAFIDDEERGLVEMAVEKNELLQKAQEELEYLTGDDEVKRMAFLHEKWERDYESGMEQAREEGHESGLKEGRAEGRESGLKEGRAEGRESGLKEGRAEGRESGLQEGRNEGKQSEKIEIARKMKQKGMDIQTIIELTGLKEEEIKNIK